MELLAVGGLAYLGTLLNNRVTSEYDKISEIKSQKKPRSAKNEKKPENVEKFNFFNKWSFNNIFIFE